MQGKRAVVTGGTRGTGRAITLALADAGATVYAIYAHNREAAADLAKLAAVRGIDIRCIRADLTDQQRVNDCVQAIQNDTGEVNIVVHSAASGVHRNVVELTPKHLAWTLNVNVFGIHQLLSRLFPMIPRGGRIIGITSQGSVRVLPHYAAIGSSKGTLESLFRYYAFELAPRGIAVNVVSPGLVLTGALDAFPDRDQRIQASLAATPTGRLTTPEDVGAVVLFMCTDAASQIVGQTIAIDGGRMLA